MVEIRRLTAADQSRYLRPLAEVLVDCVAGGASVSFVLPFGAADAEAYFEKIFRDVAEGGRILLAAFAGERLVGTVQLVTAQPPNQPHRADVSKLLVLLSARGRGVGRLLMERLEEESRAAGKSLLVLDTATGSAAERLYETWGWNRVGVIPRYAVFPDGSFCDTTVFWKQLTP